MLTLIFRTLTALVSFLLRFEPGLRLLVRIRRRDGLKWGVPAMLIAVPYFLIASTCVQIIENGGPGLLYLLVLWSVVIGGAFILMGPLSLMLLCLANITEAIRRYRPRNGHASLGNEAQESLDSDLA